MTRLDKEWMRRRAALLVGGAGAVLVAAITWLAGIDAGHVLLATVAVAALGVVGHVVQHDDAGVDRPWEHHPAPPSAAGVRTDVERLARRVPADVEGRPNHAAPEVLAVARDLAATRLARAGLDPRRDADAVRALLGPGAAAVLTGDDAQVRTRDLRRALDRLAALGPEPARPAPTVQPPSVRSTP